MCQQSSQFVESEWKEALLNFEINLNVLYYTESLNMTLKIHIIIHHYKFYFEKMGKNFKDTNGEFGETLHYTLKSMNKLITLWGEKKERYSPPFGKSPQKHQSYQCHKNGLPCYKTRADTAQTHGPPRSV